MITISVNNDACQNLRDNVLNDEFKNGLLTAQKLKLLHISAFYIGYMHFN